MLKSIAAAVLCLTLASPAQDMLAVGYARYVYSLDSTSGQANLTGIGMLGQGGLARDGAGTLWSTGYTAAASGLTYYLTRIEASNGLVQPMFVTVPFRSLASDTGTSLFGLVDATPADILRRIDTTTGQSVVVGSLGLANATAIVARNGQLYGWDSSIGLVTIDAPTGHATDVNPAVAGPTIAWLAVREDGALIGGGGTSVYAIDPTTGATTFTSYTSGSNLTGAVASGLASGIGVGCNGGLGQVNLTVSGALRAGTVLTSQSAGHGLGTFGSTLVLGFSRTSHGGFALPLDLDPLLGTQDCTLQTSVDSLSTGRTTLGLAQFFVPLPAGFGGATFYLQHAVFEPAVPGGMSWSGAVRVHIGM